MFTAEEHPKELTLASNGRGLDGQVPKLHQVATCGGPWRSEIQHQCSLSISHDSSTLHLLKPNGGKGFWDVISLGRWFHHHLLNFNFQVDQLDHPLVSLASFCLYILSLAGHLVVVVTEAPGLYVVGER